MPLRHRAPTVLAAAALVWGGAAAPAEGSCAEGGRCLAAQAGDGAAGDSALMQLGARRGARAAAARGADAASGGEGAERAPANLSAALRAGGARPATASERQEFLQAHNVYRCMHGSPAVAWSDAVAASAESWIAPLTAMQHSDSYSIPPPAGPAGENLYASSARAAPQGVVDLWYGEVDNCRGGPGGFTDGCQTGAKGVTGHFTALIWKGVKQIGCAWSNNGKLAICRYKSDDVLNANSANMLPQSNYVAQVPRRVKTLAQCQGSSSGGPSTGKPSAPAPPTASAPAPAPGCTDSTKYKDPWFGRSCSFWAKRSCNLLPFSKSLKKKCPKACGKC